MTKTQLKQATLWLWPLFLIALTFCIRIPLIKVRATILPGDEVMFGLMAKHILAGHFPIYYFGQGYLGALEAYVTSSLSLIMGLNGWTVQIGSFLFYSLFMITHFFLIRRLFGLRVSLLSSVLLVMAPVMFWELSVRALGGYTEILFLGSLSFLLWLKVYSDGKRGFLFPLGLSLGLGLWLNPLFFMYLVPLIILTLFWHQGFAERALWLHPIHLLTLKGFKLPPWVKIFLWILHGFILLYLVKQFVVFFTGGWELKILGWDFSRPPFHWKGVRKLFWVLFFEGIGLSLLSVGWTHVLTFLRRNLGWIFGFFLGQLPVILHGVIGREGHRILQGSSAISSDQFLEKLGIIFVKFIPVSVWGISKHTMSLQWYEQAGALFILILFLIAFAFYFFSYRSEWQALTRFRGGIKKEGFFFCLLTVRFYELGFGLRICIKNNSLPVKLVNKILVLRDSHVPLERQKLQPLLAVKTDTVGIIITRRAPS